MAGETPQQKLALQEGDKSIDIDPNPGMVLISCAAAELIPTVQYGNVTIGPVAVKRWIKDTGNDLELKQEISKTQSLCEEAVAEDRKTVHALTRQSQQGRYEA